MTFDYAQKEKNVIPLKGKIKYKHAEPPEAGQLRRWDTRKSELFYVIEVDGVRCDVLWEGHIERFVAAYVQSASSAVKHAW
jgi:hypothetical protein